MTPSATATPTLSSQEEDRVEDRAYESRTPPVASRPPESSVESSQSLLPLGEALRALVGLPKNWDGYGALPPSPSALEHAWALASMLNEHGLPIPEVFPTRSGGVQLEWHVTNGSLEWELDANAATGVFVFDDHLSDERLDGELPDDLSLLAEALSRIMRG